MIREVAQVELRTAEESQAAWVAGGACCHSELGSQEEVEVGQEGRRSEV